MLLLYQLNMTWRDTNSAPHYRIYLFLYYNAPTHKYKSFSQLFTSSLISAKKDSIGGGRKKNNAKEWDDDDDDDIFST